MLVILNSVEDIEQNLRCIHLQLQQQLLIGQSVLLERCRHFRMYIDWLYPVDRYDYITWQRPHGVLERRRLENESQG